MTIGALLAVVLSVAVASSACVVPEPAATPPRSGRGGPGAGARTTPVGSGVGQLVRELESRGADVRLSGAKCLPIPTRRLGAREDAQPQDASGTASPTGSAYRLGARGRPGYESLCLYPYPDPSSAEADAALVPPDADNGMTDWVADPRFYRCGRVIGVYTGYDERNIQTLTEICGQPFAKGEGAPPSP